MNPQERRCRGNLIQVFKIVKWFDKLPFSHFFEVSKSNIKTRGHKYKLVSKISDLNIRKYFFSQRVVDIWNSLDESVVDAESVNAFKNGLDKSRYWNKIPLKLRNRN